MPVPAGAIQKYLQCQFPISALWFVFRSGFTPLTERMCNKGMAGVEELSRHLNNYFGPICDRIYECVSENFSTLDF